MPACMFLYELFKNTDILNKITEPDTVSGQYVSCSDGSHFLENELLSTGDLVVPLQLYIELEIANPLGTSHKIHRLCAVYWVLANVPPKYRSALHAIQLAKVVKVTDLHKYGYAAVLHSTVLHFCVMFILWKKMVSSLKEWVRISEAPSFVFLLTIWPLVD